MVGNKFSQNTQIKYNYINVGSVPKANFIANQTKGTAPFTVTFTDVSSNNPTAWKWNLGDGDTSTQQNLAYTYNDPGTYTVTLIVTNNFGSDTAIKKDYIQVVKAVNAPPVASFTVSPTNGKIKHPVCF